MLVKAIFLTLAMVAGIFLGTTALIAVIGQEFIGAMLRIIAVFCIMASGCYFLNPETGSDNSKQSLACGVVSVIMVELTLLLGSA